MLSLQHKLQCSGSAPVSPGTEAQLGQGQHKASRQLCPPQQCLGRGDQHGGEAATAHFLPGRAGTAIPQAAQCPAPSENKE